MKEAGFSIVDLKSICEKRKGLEDRKGAQLGDCERKQNIWHTNEQ
jgi:hypothetical protein